MTPRTLHISRDLALPLDAVTSTMIVYGGRGMGKTNLLGVTVEEMSRAGLRWCSIDPIGVHWGLRHSADGKGAGIECLILGGVHGDMPITPASGEIVADLVADEHVNVIVDCSRNASGAMWSVGERTRFITAFALRLFQRQGSMIDGHRREPIFVALDEAARYIPQTIPHGNPDLSKSLGAWEQLVEVGRNVGIGVGLFTQRSARLAKSVAELADTMIAFRTTGPNSIDAIIDWLGEHVPKADQRVMIEQIRRLPVGTALVVSPGWLDFEGVVAIRTRETFDSSATPKPGERARRVTGSGATVDLAAYQARMADTIERVKADDPKALRAEVKAARVEVDEALAAAHRADRDAVAARAEIERLNAELADRPAPPDFAAITAAITVAAQRAGAAVREQIEAMSAAITAALEAEAARAQNAPPFAPRVPQKAPEPARRAPEAPHSAPREAQSATPGTQPDTALSKSERAVLTALAQHGARPTVRLAHLAGYSPRGGAYNRTLTSLRGSGYVESGTGGLDITQAGRDALGDYTPMPTGRALVDHWLGVVGTAQEKILTALGEAYPDAVHRDALAEQCGYSAVGGAYNRAITALRKVELVDGPGNALRIAQDLGEAWQG